MLGLLFLVHFVNDEIFDIFHSAAGKFMAGKFEYNGCTSDCSIRILAVLVSDSSNRLESSQSLYQESMILTYFCSSLLSDLTARTTLSLINRHNASKHFALKSSGSMGIDRQVGIMLL
jgi:hypothetical protein